MSKNKFLIDKSRMPLSMGIAFIAFTTQFGGGFASGAQIKQYFINYGVWCLILPLLSQALYALFFWYGMRYSYKHKTYDYRSFSDSFYGNTRIVMSNLFEITYLIMIGTASAAAFATGGSTLNTLTNIPYWFCTLLIAVFIFFIAMYGTSMVRAAASTLSVLILLGLFLVLIPNIIYQFPLITENISKMAAGEMVAGSGESGAFLPALYMSFLYFLFQLPSVSVMYQHMEPVTDKKQINKAAIYIFIVNFLSMEIAVIGLLAVMFMGSMAEASVPMLILVQNGVGDIVFTPIISLLIILGSISTGVNMIAGIVARTVNAWEKHQVRDSEIRGHRMRMAISTIIFTLAAWGIAQFGLMAVVRRGYAYLGYAGFLTVFIPFVIHAVVTRMKKI